MGVHAVDTGGEPVLAERRPPVLLADGGPDLPEVPLDRGVEPGDREDHQHLPEVRLPEEREQGGNHLQ